MSPEPNSSSSNEQQLAIERLSAPSCEERAGEVWERYGQLFLVLATHDGWHEVLFLELGGLARVEERRPWELAANAWFARVA